LYSTPDASFALNRPLSEDAVDVVSDASLEQVLSGLNYTRIDDKAGSAMALASEVWRTFLMLMVVALMAEALLCVPEKLTLGASEPKAKPITQSAAPVAAFQWKSSANKGSETKASGSSTS
jgi:hypothetical protein